MIDGRELQSLETRLLDVTVRRDADAVAALLDDTFVELGASGRFYDARAVIRALRAEASGAMSPRRSIHDFEAKSLAPDLALAVYRCVDEARGETSRASVWIARGGSWKMLLHQGFTRPPVNGRGALRLRDARPDERATLECLQLRSSLVWPEHRAEVLNDPNAVAVSASAIVAGHVRVAERSGTVVGFATLVPTGEHVAELDALFTDPEALRTGVGRALVGDLVERAPASRIDVTANPRALDFYAAIGFVDAGEATTPFGPARRMRLAPRV